MINRTPTSPFTADCWKCAKIASEKCKERGDHVSANSFIMYLCPECGEKRCDKAADHDKECSEKQ